MSKANAFSALFKEAGRHGVAETDKVEETPSQQPSIRSRSRGKREDPAFGKIGVYIQNSTIMDVKARLLRQERDLSDLVQALLDEWLKRE